MVVRQRQQKRGNASVPLAGNIQAAFASTVDVTDNAVAHSSEENGEHQLPTGRTPDGKAFSVPKTRDMMQSLFNPLTPKTTFDLVTLLALSTHMLVSLAFPLAAKRMILMTSFAFWRLCYNGGLGWILNWQSSRHGLVALFKRKGWLDPGRGGKIYVWLRGELEAKMGPDYSFESVPIEFNVWLLYRQLVDLILLNDFAAYFFLCSCYIGSANDAEPWHSPLRIAGGMILLAFNLWVKVDAHRVVRDYAWYWGDFFFLIEQTLTFDGVFEMAPHPMYSIGYAGYYGGSLITGSYTVFYISLAAHMLQFLFLSFVENPHIEKTYERPPLAVQVIKKSRTRRLSLPLSDSTDEATKDASGPCNKNSIREKHSSMWRPDLIVFKHFDLFRASDILIVLLLTYSVGVPVCFMWITGYTQMVLKYAIVQCIGWILFRTLALGLLLKKQSTSQLITRWYIKRGGNSEEAFSSWRAVYNTAMIMTYASFGLVALAAYHWGNADYGSIVLFHTLGFLLIGFHVWSSRSVYDILGDFGWFYGDFFARDSSMLSLAPTDIKLYYTGIYRYLNNPEKVIGQAAFYGLALISRSQAVFALALLLQMCTFLFGAYVEMPHMQKIYGAQVRRDSGIIRTVKNAVNKGIGQSVFLDSALHVESESGLLHSTASDSSTMVHLLANTTKPVRDILLETKDLISITTARIAEKTVPSELSKVDYPAFYSLKLLPGRALNACGIDRKKETSAKNDGNKNVYYLGESIRVTWQAPFGHSRRDWIGIYPVTANFSNQITTVSSKGCYVYIHPDENLLTEMVVGDSVFASRVQKMVSFKANSGGNKEKRRGAGVIQVLQGESLFSSVALPFKTGTYEMRLHHGGTHAVLAQSRPFEITACDANDVMEALGDECALGLQSPHAGTGQANESDTLGMRTGTSRSADLEDPEVLSQALLVVVNKTFTVTDSHVIAPSSPRESEKHNMNEIGIHDVVVETDVVEPLESIHDVIAADNVLEEKQSKRLGYAIKAYFGVEFAADVLVHAAKHGATVYDVGKRIVEARKALSLYSSTNIEA